MNRRRTIHPGGSKPLPSGAQLALVATVGALLAALVLRWSGPDATAPRGAAELDPLAARVELAAALADRHAGDDAPAALDAEIAAGLPPAEATRVPGGDSLPARRQALARTVRDLIEQRPSAAAEADPETTAAVARAVRAALIDRMNRKGDDQ
ncbi:MAG TPA: hypothetical protein VIS07_06200 [Candidatus Binatia bacterium]